MPGSQQDAANGKKARDAALTWDVPPPLEVDKVAVAGRAAFAAVAGKHLEALVHQLLDAEGVEAVGEWVPVVCQLAQQAAAALSPSAAVAHGKLDPRFYIKVSAARRWLQAGPVHACLLLHAARGLQQAGRCIAASAAGPLVSAK